MAVLRNDEMAVEKNEEEQYRWTVNEAVRGFIYKTDERGQVI